MMTAKKTYLEDETATVNINCSDATIEGISVKVLLVSRTMSAILEGKALDDKSAIDMSFMNAATLTNSIQWIQQHIDDPKDTMPVNDYFSEWDKQFFTRNDGQLHLLLNAAVYLDIPRFIDECCFSLLRLIRGKTIDQIRHFFQIKQTFTESQRKRYENENSWCATFNT